MPQKNRLDKSTPIFTEEELANEGGSIGFWGWVWILLNSTSSIYKHQFLKIRPIDKAAEAGLNDWDNAKKRDHSQLLKRSAYPYKIILAAYSWLTWGVTYFISALSLIPWVIGSLAFCALKWISACSLMPALNSLSHSEKNDCKTEYLFTLPWNNDKPTFSDNMNISFLLFLKIWIPKYPETKKNFLWSFLQTLFLIIFFLVNLAEGLFNLGCGLLVFVPKLVHDGLIFLADVFIVGRPLGLKYQLLLSVALLAVTLYFAFFGTAAAAVLPALLTGVICFVAIQLLDSRYNRLPGVMGLGGSMFNICFWALAAASIVLMVCSPQLLLAVPIAIKAALLPSVSTTVFSWLFATFMGVFTAFMSVFVIAPLLACLAERCGLFSDTTVVTVSYLIPDRQRDNQERAKHSRNGQSSHPKEEPEPSCCPSPASLCASFCSLFSSSAGAEDESENSTSSPQVVGGV